MSAPYGTTSCTSTPLQQRDLIHLAFFRNIDDIHTDTNSPFHQFSAKMFKTLYSHVLPAAKSKPYANSVQFIFRQQIQPWHPSSTLVHESGAAVLRLAPDKFWEYSAALFEKSSEYYDVSVVSEERNHTYERLAKLAGSVGVDPGKVEELLWVEHEAGEDGALNVGNKVTDDVKLMVKVSVVVLVVVDAVR